MVPKFFLRTFLLIIVMVLFFILTVYASSSSVLFIIDSSGSMSQKLGGETRLDAAKRVFSDLINGLPSEINVGLEVYGHRGEKDCSAIEVVQPVTRLDRDALKSKIASLKAEKGATPIADALITGAEVLKKVKGSKSIVLISDGKETCGGDPVATVKRLKKQGIDVKVHVVGFTVGTEERKQLEAIAGAGGGNYYQADNSNALAESLKKIKSTVAVTKSKVLIKDGFDEEYLAEHWEIKNPNPDSIIVEDGFLQILTDLPKDNLLEPTNLVLLKKELPKQWEAILRLRHTLMDSWSWYKNQVAGLILYRDKNNGIMLAVSNWDYASSTQAVNFAKVKKGKWMPGFKAELGKPVEEREVVIRLQRIKRKFVASFLNSKGKWQKIGEFTELRPKYKLGIFALRGDGRSREAMEKFDSFELKEIR